MADRGERFGSFIRELRETERLSLRQAAKRIGVTHPRLAELEAGITHATGRPTRPTREMVQRIARTYGVAYDTLLDLAGYAREHSELSDEDALMLDHFRSLDLRGKRTALRMMVVLREELEVGLNPRLAEVFSKDGTRWVAEGPPPEEPA